MQTYKLYNILAEKDKKRLDAVMKSSTRKPLKKLYNYIKKTSEDDYDKQKASEVVFDEPYSTKLDNRLRQQLLALNGHIRDVLIQKGLRYELRANNTFEDYLYCRGLYDSRAYELLLEELPKQIEKGFQLHLPYINAKMLYTYGIVVNRMHPRSTETIDLQLELYQKVIEENKRHLLYEQRRMEAMIAQFRALKNLVMGTKTEEVGDGLGNDTITFNKELLEDPLTRYYTQSRIGFEKKGAERLAEELKLLEILRKLETNAFDPIFTEVRLLTQIAFMYVSLDQYEEGNDYFDQAIALSKTHDYRINPTNLTNALMCKANLGLCQETIALYHEYLYLFKDTENEYHVRRSVAYCYIQLGQTDLTRQYLDLSSNLSAPVWVESRLLEVVMLASEDANEVALNSLESAIRSIRQRVKQQELEGIYETIANILRGYIKTIHDNGSKKAQKMEQLLGELVDAVPPASRYSYSHTVYWLRKKLSAQ